MNKRILVFDTETTGFASKKQKDLSKQPYIVQYAHVDIHVNGDNWDIEEQKSKMYKVPIWIPKQASNIHGITNDRLKNKDTISEDIIEIRKKMEKADLLVAHNANFDMNMIWLELARVGAHSELINLREKVLCLMKATTELCELPKKRGSGYKWPKLTELHYHLFGDGFEGAHDAMADVMATVRCLQELVHLKIIDIT